MCAGLGVPECSLGCARMLRPRSSRAENRRGRLPGGDPGQAPASASVLPSPTPGPAASGPAGGGPGYLLQQGPQAQLVRAAALRPLAHIGRRHQPLAGTEILRVHGRGAGGGAACGGTGGGGCCCRHRRSPSAPGPSCAVRWTTAPAGQFPPERGGLWVAHAVAHAPPRSAGASLLTEAGRGIRASR